MAKATVVAVKTANAMAEVETRLANIEAILQRILKLLKPPSVNVPEKKSA